MDSHSTHGGNIDVLEEKRLNIKFLGSIRNNLSTCPQGRCAVRETTVEQALIRAVHARGGLCWKFVSPGLAGVPDRIIILPGGHVGFIEVKAPGQHPRPLQTRRLNQLRTLGITALTIDHPNQIEEALHEIQTA